MKVLTLVRLSKIISENTHSVFVFSNKEQITVKGNTAAVNMSHLIGLPRTTVIRLVRNMGT